MRKNFLIILISLIVISLPIILVNAKATKTEFIGSAAWAGADPFTDRIAGMTTHRRMRITNFAIASEDDNLDGTTLERLVNFNRNDLRNSVQRWGKFEIKSGEVLLWSGSWRGYRQPDSAVIEYFVGHGVSNDLMGMSIRFTLTEGTISGTILNPNK